MKLNLFSSVIAALTVALSLTASAVTVDIISKPYDQPFVHGAVMTTHEQDYSVDEPVSPIALPIYINGNASVIENIVVRDYETGKVVAEVSPPDAIEHYGYVYAKFINGYTMLPGKLNSLDIQVVGNYNSADAQHANVWLSPADPMFDNIQVTFTGDEWMYANLNQIDQWHQARGVTVVRSGDVVSDTVPGKGLRNITSLRILPENGTTETWVRNLSFTVTADTSYNKKPFTLGVAANVGPLALRGASGQVLHANVTQMGGDTTHSTATFPGWVQIPPGGLTVFVKANPIRIKSFSLAANVGDWVVFTTDGTNEDQVKVNGPWGADSIAGPSKKVRNQ